MNVRQVHLIIVMTMQLAQTPTDHTRVPAKPGIPVMDGAAMVYTNLLFPEREIERES